MFFGSSVKRPNRKQDKITWTIQLIINGLYVTIKPFDSPVFPGKDFLTETVMSVCEELIRPNNREKAKKPTKKRGEKRDGWTETIYSRCSFITQSALSPATTRGESNWEHKTSGMNKKKRKRKSRLLGGDRIRSEWQEVVVSWTVWTV